MKREVDVSVSTIGSSAGRLLNIRLNGATGNFPQIVTWDEAAEIYKQLARVLLKHDQEETMLTLEYGPRIPSGDDL